MAETTTAPTKAKSKKMYWIIGGIVLLLLIIGGVVYYFKVYKPKQIAAQNQKDADVLSSAVSIAFQKWANKKYNLNLRTDGNLDAASEDAFTKYGVEFETALNGIAA